MHDNVIQEVENMMNTSQGLHELGSRPVHLKMKDDEQKLSFQRNKMTASTNNKNSSMMKYNSSGNIQDFDESVRPNVPTRGQTMGINSQLDGGYDHMSQVRSSQRSGIHKSGALVSGMHAYASSGVNSGMSKREAEIGGGANYNTYQSSGVYKSPGVSRLPMVDHLHGGGG